MHYITITFKTIALHYDYNYRGFDNVMYYITITSQSNALHYNYIKRFTRSDNQLREIRPSSSSSVHFHRDGVSDPYQYRQSTSSQANEDIGVSQNILTENLCISQRFPVPLGTTECCSRLCNAGTVTSPAITNISAQTVATTEISVESPDWFDNENSATPQMVASGRSVSSWADLGSITLKCNALHYNYFQVSSYRNPIHFSIIVFLK